VKKRSRLLYRKKGKGKRARKGVLAEARSTKGERPLPASSVLEEITENKREAYSSHLLSKERAAMGRVERRTRRAVVADRMGMGREGGGNLAFVYMGTFLKRTK